MVKEYVKELREKTFSVFNKNCEEVTFKISENKEKFVNNKGKRVQVNKDLKTKNINNKTKQEAIALVDELVVSSSYDGSKPAKYPHGWVDNYGKNEWEYWNTYVCDKENTIWEVTLNIATSQNDEKILYDIDPIKKVGRSVKSDTIPTFNSIPQAELSVKQFSLEEETQNSPESNVKYSYVGEKAQTANTVNLKKAILVIIIKSSFQIYRKAV